MKQGRHPSFPGAVLGLLALLSLGILGTSPLRAQLYINEVIAENSDEGPADICDGHPDMVEIYNAGASQVSLAGYFLSDAETFNAQLAWPIPAATDVPAGGSVVIFCDGNLLQGLCERHATFSVDNNGAEPISLWSPSQTLVDRVWLPPLRNNTSFGRLADGLGGQNVSVEDAWDFFGFFGPGATTLGSCINVGGNCMPGCATGLPNRQRRACFGASNTNPPTNLEPRIERESHSSVQPAAGAPVHFVARVEDDKEPTPSNIARVQIRYTVDGAARPPIDLTCMGCEGGGSGVLTGAEKVPPRPLERWTLWEGSIPGQPAGSHVVFEFYVEDAEGLSSTSPRIQCAPGTGPCDDLGLPGPGCVLELDDMGMPGLQYAPCEHQRQYLVAYAAPSPLSGLVINEVVATQDVLLADRTQPACPTGDPNCAYEDFIEIHNSSGAPVDLSRVWLSDRSFQPQGWRFPAGASIASGEYVIVWLDNDGGRCPRPPEVPGDGQECPDPTDATIDEYHANFNLDGGGDQVYIFEDLEDGTFGVVHGVEFGDQELNVSLSLCPDGSRNGLFRATPGGTPLAENDCVVEPVFIRGDSNNDCTVNIADATHILNFLFLGGSVPACRDASDTDDTGTVLITDAVYLLNALFTGGSPVKPPGHLAPGGTDPSADKLPLCVPRDCSA